MTVYDWPNKKTKKTVGLDRNGSPLDPVRIFGASRLLERVDGRDPTIWIPQSPPNRTRAEQTHKRDTRKRKETNMRDATMKI